jgi:uncharacterized repeat protein (TIGR03803 family)
MFKLDSNGNFTLLHSFSGIGSEGCGTRTGLIQASDGNFYGTTQGGGTGGNNGTIFKIDSNGNLIPLFSFNGTNGRQPSQLIQASDGMFYGTTSTSGAANPGTVFRIDSTGNFTTLHFFSVTEGSQMRDYGLVQASDGNFYGVAAAGGSTQCAQAPTFQSGCGTVFKMDIAGNLTVLHSFNGNDGSQPYGGVIRGIDGKFYGTTLAGGIFDFGTIFRVDADGANFQVLHSFDGNDGKEPVHLIQPSDGNFYGTTLIAPGFGSIFRMDALSKVVTTVHTFDFIDGYNPSWLIQASDGDLYGSTASGGTADAATAAGIVFRASLGLPAPSPTPAPAGGCGTDMISNGWNTRITEFATAFLDSSGFLNIAWKNNGADEYYFSFSLEGYDTGTCQYHHVINDIYGTPSAWVPAGHSFGIQFISSDQVQFKDFTTGQLLQLRPDLPSYPSVFTIDRSRFPDLGAGFGLNIWSPLDVNNGNASSRSYLSPSGLSPTLFFRGSLDPRLFGGYFNEPVIDSQGCLLLVTRYSS